MMVHGIICPLSSKILVIPSFLPNMPLTVLLLSHLPTDSLFWGRAGKPQWSIRSSSSPSLHLDLDIHPGRQFQLHQGIDGLARGVENVDQPLVRPGLELLAR